MTRFGVMKHLRVLEAAGLVVTRRACRVSALTDAITKPEWTRRWGYGLRDQYDLRPDSCGSPTRSSKAATA